MPQRSAVIQSASGLHARPAHIFTQAAAAAGLPVTIGRPGDAGVMASSLLMIMGLGLKQGDEVVLHVADGPDAQAKLDELCALLEEDLDARA